MVVVWQVCVLNLSFMFVFLDVFYFCGGGEQFEDLFDVDFDGVVFEVGIVEYGVQGFVGGQFMSEDVVNVIVVVEVGSQCVLIYEVYVFVLNKFFFDGQGQVYILVQYYLEQQVFGVLVGFYVVYGIEQIVLGDGIGVVEYVSYVGCVDIQYVKVFIGVVYIEMIGSDFQFFKC